MLANSTGKLRALSVGQLYLEYYNWGKPNTFEKSYERLGKENTYINVFGPTQLDLLERFKKEPNINILFESKKAVNTGYREYYGEETRPNMTWYELDRVKWERQQKAKGRPDGGLKRNTVVVWEFKDVA